MVTDIFRKMVQNHNTIVTFLLKNRISLPKNKQKNHESRRESDIKDHIFVKNKYHYSIVIWITEYFPKKC